MDKIDKAFQVMQAYFKKNADPKIVEKYSRFFREGYDPYGVDPHKLAPQVEEWYEQLEPEFKKSDFKKLFVKLMEAGREECFSVVIIFLRSMEKYYSPALFKNIKTWVGKYFTNWAQVDSLCARTISGMILNDVVSYDDLLEWHTHKSKWVRRCVPVGTVYGFYKQKDIKPVKKVAEALINDPVREVGQGVGWMLRDTWKVYPNQIEKLLLKHVKTGNRTAYQYACEKMDKEYRKKFRRPKPPKSA
jgi:3-methyladenine DNA glycosylase AlkD